MSTDNPIWGSPRIQGELQKLGINIAKSTIEKYMIKNKKPPSLSWRSFLKDYAKETVALDFFIVPTIRFKLLFVLVILSHDRRKILHTEVTRNPTAHWSSQQLRNAFDLKDLPLFFLHDNDKCFSGLSTMGAEEVITAKASPWQNPYVERVIGTIRRECTDHWIFLNASHLKKILNSYTQYYNETRTHLSLAMDAPIPRQLQSKGKVIAKSQVHGLHHRYERVAA